MSMARQDGLTSVLEASRESETSPVILQGAKDVSEVGHGKETSMEETDEERIGGISQPVVAPLLDDTGPFCLFRPRVQGNTEGASATATNPAHGDLQQLLHSFSSGTAPQGKKMKSSLSSFLPTIPGDVDNPGVGDASLLTLVHNPPIGGKELVNLPPHLLLGFRLRPGPIPEQFRTAFHEKPKKKKRKKPKFPSLEQQNKTESIVPAPADARRDGLTSAPANASLLGSIGTTKSIPVPNISSGSSVLPVAQNGTEIAQQVTKKPKKRKHEDGDRDKDKKKKKKDKKKKKEKHQSPHPDASGHTFQDNRKTL